MPYAFQALSEEPLIYIEENHVLNKVQRLTEVKWRKVCFYD